MDDMDHRKRSTVNPLECMITLDMLSLYDGGKSNRIDNLDDQAKYLDSPLGTL